ITEAQTKAAATDRQNELEHEREMAKQANDMELARMELESKERTAIEVARINQETSIITARIAAKATGGQIEEAEAAAKDDEMLGPARKSDVAAIEAKIEQMSSTVQDVANRDPNAAPPHPAVVGALQTVAHTLAQGQTMIGNQHREDMAAHAAVHDAVTS